MFFASCKWCYYTAPRIIKKEFTYKYNGGKTNIDSLININGYYVSNSYYIGDMPWYDTIYINGNMMFFKDGMYTDLLSNVYSLHRYKDVSEYLYNIHQDDSLGGPNDFYEKCVWGQYLLCDDTIKIQYVVRPMLYSSSGSWSAMEIWYKIINKDMLLLVFAKPIGISKTKKAYYYEIEKRKPVIRLPDTFIPTEVQPSSNGWIKREKWFWENKEDWKKYMDSLKMGKKNKR